MDRSGTNDNVCQYVENPDYPPVRKYLEGIARFKRGTPEDAIDHMKRFMDMVRKNYSGFIFKGPTSFDDA